MNQTEPVEAHMNVERATTNNHCVVGDMGGAIARGDLERVRTQLQAEPDPIEVLIVDDHPMVREGLAGVLERHGMKIVGLAANGKQAVEMYSAHRPDILLLDLRLPDQSGFEVVRTVLTTDPQARIIILSSAQGDALIYNAISLGVRGYLLKGIDGSSLAAQVRHVAAGGSCFLPETAEKLTQYISSQKLSEGEIEVLSLISKGKNNKEIAALILVTESTVKMRVRNILLKLQANHRTQAVVIAIQRGLIDV
jgi:DNA-binding NarL/FixJ family response regulator